MAHQPEPKNPTAGKPGKRNALGRGLGALLPGAGAGAEPDALAADPADGPGTAVIPISNPVGGMGTYEIPLLAVEANPYQPRSDFDTDALEELRDSIRAQGVIQPITVREIEPGRYQIIAGERRVRAARLAGLVTIPAFVRMANDEQMLEMAIVENVQRADLNPIEEALAYRRLMEECSLVIEQVGNRVGKKRSTVNNYIRLLKLPPDIQAAVRDGQLTMGHARALISLENPIHQLQIYREVVQRGLSVRAVEDLARRFAEPKAPAAAEPKIAPTPFEIQLRSVVRDLEGRFGTKVKIDHQPHGAGEIRLRYFSQEDLDRLLELLNG